MKNGKDASTQVEGAHRLAGEMQPLIPEKLITDPIEQRVAAAEHCRGQEAEAAVLKDSLSQAERPKAVRYVYSHPTHGLRWFPTFDEPQPDLSNGWETVPVYLASPQTCREVPAQPPAAHEVDPLIKTACGCPSRDIVEAGYSAHLHQDAGRPITAYLLDFDYTHSVAATNMDAAVFEVRGLLKTLAAILPTKPAAQVPHEWHYELSKAVEWLEKAPATGLQHAAMNKLRGLLAAAPKRGNT